MHRIFNRAAQGAGQPAGTEFLAAAAAFGPATVDWLKSVLGLRLAAARARRENHRHRRWLDFTGFRRCGQGLDRFGLGHVGIGGHVLLSGCVIGWMGLAGRLAQLGALRQVTDHGLADRVPAV